MVRRVISTKHYTPRAIVGPPGPGEPEYNPNNAFPFPEARFFLEKDEVLDWELPPGGTYTIANAYFKVYDFGIGAVGNWLATRASNDILDASQQHGVLALGYRLWKDDQGFISHDYLLQIALAGRSPVAPLIVVAVVILTLSLLALVSQPIIRDFKNIVIGTPESPPIFIPEGTPAPPGTVDSEGRPVPPGTPAPPGAYIPGKSRQKGLLDALGPAVPVLALGILGLVAFNMVQNSRR